MDRRRLMLGAGALAATSPFFLPRSLARAGQTGDPFSLGVASGEPWPDGFVIWTRIAPQPLAADGQGGLLGPVAVQWQVAEDEAMRAVVQSGEVVADARLAHSIHVETTGLQPDRPYWYRFTALGAQSPTGAARTAPARGARLEAMKIAVASCANYEVGYFSAYRHMAQERPDLVIFTGDYIYEYSYALSRDTPRRHDRSEEIADLVAYRNRYALYKSDADLRALHQAAPCLTIWDDHEVQNDYADDWSQIYGMPRDIFRARRNAAYQAYYEHTPLRRRSVQTADGGMRIYDRFVWGDLAEFTQLDGRQYRSIQGCQRPNNRRAWVAPQTCPDLIDPTRTLLGFEQESWLYEGFRRASTRWNVLVQPILLAPYIQKGADGQLGIYSDGWAAHGLARQRLLTAMNDAALKNAIVLSGDMHGSVAANVHASDTDPSSPVIAAEFLGTSITSDNAPARLAETLDINPHVKMFDMTTQGYMSISLDHQSWETRYQVISDRTDPNATVRTDRVLHVAAGKPGIVEG